MTITKRYTKYVSRDLSFADLADIATALDKEYLDAEALVPEVKILVAIVNMHTGEVLASRDSLGLWEINR